MNKVWLVEDRSVRMFVQFEQEKVSFGFLDTRDKHEPYEGYIISFTMDQWNEIGELWNSYNKGETLPESAGYLKE